MSTLKRDSCIRHRKQIRLKEYDYSLPGEYFVTIANITQPWQQFNTVIASRKYKHPVWDERLYSDETHVSVFPCALARGLIFVFFKQSCCLIYYPLGREVAVLVNEQKPAGRYAVQWNASKMANGIYFYSLQT